MESVKTQASVFEGQANIYAPMYRQMNIAGLGLSDDAAAPLQEIVHNDVWRAFTYYLKYENNGRPFFLAGHSQGSMILTDLLLKHWGTTGAEKQLVAALLIGWSLTPEDLDAHPSVHMCKSSDQTGCVISYNTMAEGRQSAAPTLKKGALAVNPLSWSMDGAFVPAEKNLGSVFFDNSFTPTSYPEFTSAQIVGGGLIVQPKDVNLVTVEGGHFPKGVYHAFDYSLFFENLKANIAERINAFAR
jgi:pimeloyl-ACP methyl ester carboxylesterase